MSPVRAGPLISAGNAVAGFPDQLADVADLLSRSEIPFGTVEFAHQLGERELARLMNDVVVFVQFDPPGRTGAVDRPTGAGSFQSGGVGTPGAGAVHTPAPAWPV